MGVWAAKEIGRIEDGRIDRHPAESSAGYDLGIRLKQVEGLGAGNYRAEPSEECSMHGKSCSRWHADCPTGCANGPPRFVQCLDVNSSHLRSPHGQEAQRAPR